MERALTVHLDLAGAPVLVGRLWARSRGGRDSASFEYDRTWLARPGAFALEPDLLLHLKHEISTVSERPSVGERVLRLESLPEECDRGSHLLHRDSCIAELREVSGFDELTPGDVWAVGRVLTDDRCVLFAAAGVAVDPPL